MNDDASAVVFHPGKPWQTLRALYRPRRRDVFAGIVAYLFKASPVWGLPIITANIIDIVAGGREGGLHGILLNAGIGALLIVQNIPSGVLYARFTSRAIRGVEAKLRSALVRRLQMLSIGYHSRRNTGALQTKVLRDVESIEQMSRQLFDGGVFALMSVLVAVVVTAVRIPVFVPVYFLLVPIVVGIRLALAAKLRLYNAEFRNRIESMSNRVMGMIAMIPVTRAHAAENEALSRVESSFGEVSRAGQRLDRHSGLFGAMAWVCFMLMQLGVLVTGAVLAYQGRLSLSPGDLVLLSGYVAAVVQAVMQLNSMLPILTRGFEGIRSIGEVLDHSDLEHNDGKQVVTSVSGAFRFERVCFEYAGESGAVATLRGIDLAVKAGETIGVVGPSGSGKSTLMNLVIGFHKPTSGRISLDGRDLAEIDLRSYRRFLSVVGQETLLFEGSLRENIGYGNGDVDEGKLWEAIRAANAEEFIRKLPGGLDAMIGEGGARLSGGQRQRLAIARALLRDPRVLVLDEATSALDGGSELAVQEALERLMGGRTTFIVAHRLSTLRRVDRVIVLEDGNIVDSGSPLDLARRHPERFMGLRQERSDP